jgi:AraC-like DNA-binding protein
MSASVLYEGDLVILGETRVPAGASEFRREAVADVWPNIAFPRVPLGIRPADEPLVLGDLNTAILFPVGRPYRRISIGGGGSWTEWIELRPDVLEEIVLDHEPGAAMPAPFRAGGAPASSRAHLAHRSLREALARDGGLDALALEERALAVACEVLRAGFELHGRRRRATRASVERAQRRAVFEVQALLNHELAAPLPLSAISRAVEMSPYHLCRVFRERTGVPIHRYRDGLRVRASLDRLAERDASVLEVALDLGYANEAHFSDAFRRAFGVRPGAFRRCLQRGSRI